MLALRKEIWKENYRTRIEKTKTVKHRTHPVTVYIFYLSSTIFPCKPYICTKGFFWNRLVFKTATVSSVETQVPAEAGGTAHTQAMIFQQKAAKLSH